MSILWSVAYPGMRIVAEADKEGYNREGHPKAGTFGTLIRPSRYTSYRSRWGLDARHISGIYEADGCWYVQWDGQDTPILVDSYNVRVHDECLEHYNMRADAFWYKPVIQDKTIDWDKQEAKLHHRVRIGDLPETKFWEGDIVGPQDGTGHNFHADNEGFQRRINSIDYHFPERCPNDDRGNCYMIDWIDPKTGEYAQRGSSYGYDYDMKLIERGNLWKSYHGEPLVFRSLKEEIAFAHGTCNVEEVRNPASGLYDFNKASAK